MNQIKFLLCDLLCCLYSDSVVCTVAWHYNLMFLVLFYNHLLHDGKVFCLVSGLKFVFQLFIYTCIKKTLHTLKNDNKVIPLKKDYLKCLTWNIWLRTLFFKILENLFQELFQKLCEINTLLGVFFRNTMESSYLEIVCNNNHYQYDIIWSDRLSPEEVYKCS